MAEPEPIEPTPTFMDDVKIALRVSSSAYDDEIEMLIDAAIADLYLAGISEDKLPEPEEDPTDPLIKRAIVTYCKAHFGYDNPEAERFEKAYNAIKLHLMLSSEYGGTADAI